MDYRLYSQAVSILVTVNSVGKIKQTCHQFASLRGMTLSEAATQLSECHGKKFRFERVVQTGYVWPMPKLEVA